MKLLLDNVNLFWRKYFKDVNVLDSLIEGALNYTSSVYTNSLATLVSKSIETAPLQVQHQVQLLELRDSNFKNINVTLNGNRYLAYELEVSDIRDLPILSNSPEGVDFLEKGVDYEFVLGEEAKTPLNDLLNPESYYIVFNEDPRQTNSYLYSTEFISGNFEIEFLEEVDFNSIGLAKGSFVDLKNSDNSVVATIELGAVLPESGQYGKAYIQVYDLPDSTEEVCELLENTNSVSYAVSLNPFVYEDRVHSFWALNCSRDTYALRDLAGYMFKRVDTRSTEKYRSYLLGMTLLRTSPFTLKNIKAAVYLSAGVNVFVSSYASGDRIRTVTFSDRCTTVETIDGLYEIDKDLTLDSRIVADALLVQTLNPDGSLHSEVRNFENPDHVQTYRFEALDPIADDIEIKTQLTEPGWWDRTLGETPYVEIPESLMLRETQERRLLINYIHPNIVGHTETEIEQVQYSIAPAAVGDYGIRVGDASRNTVAYNLFKDFLSNHFVFIQLSQELNNLIEGSLLIELQEEINKTCLPGSVVFLGASINQNTSQSLDSGSDDYIPSTQELEPF